jgi:prolyl oligopeptidase
MKYIGIFMAMATVQVLTAQIQYPESKKTAQKDDYFGTTVSDPYRWLEDDNSAETMAWVAAQNKVTQAYLAGIPYREKIVQRLKQMWNYPKYGSPFKKGDWYYFYKNDGLQNQSVLYRQQGLDAAPEVFIDPNTMSADGTAVPGVPVFTKSARYCAYLQSQSGSDWQEAYVMDVANKKLLADKLEWIKFSSIAWKGEEGFYYSRYPVADADNKLSGKNEYHKIYFHRLGTTQAQDQLVYEDNAHPLRNVYASVTEDERYLVLNLSEGTSGTEIWVKDLVTNKEFVRLLKGFEHEASVVESTGSRLLVFTNADAPNYRIVSISPSQPDKENWQEIVPAKNHLLSAVGSAGGKLFLTYLENASSRVYQHNLSGSLERSIALPGIGSTSGFDGLSSDKELFYGFTSFNTPNTIYRYDIATGKTTLFRKPELNFDTDAIVTEQVFFTSKDGTQVPMFVSYKKGLVKNGKNPTLVYGYGGFNIPLTPSFSIANAFFIEQGGVYVQVSLRGGSEYGENWHKAGMLQNKQHVFNDAIAAAEYLVAQQYSSAERLAIRGGSNGGLLVGACMTQRPDLFRVAIPQVGVLDMLRYHLFTIGWAWAVEYGRSDKQEDFAYLYRYSPLHNLKKGTAYPATLITTADHDDRVVPAHSFKFAAALQEAASNQYPALIRIDTKAGHGAGKPTNKVIEEAADIWSFLFYNMNFTPTL